jgi:hypothetical protein
MPVVADAKPEALSLTYFPSSDLLLVFMSRLFECGALFLEPLHKVYDLILAHAALPSPFSTLAIATASRLQAESINPTSPSASSAARFNNASRSRPSAAPSVRTRGDELVLVASREFQRRRGRVRPVWPQGHEILRIIRCAVEMRRGAERLMTAAPTCAKRPRRALVFSRSTSCSINAWRLMSMTSSRIRPSRRSIRSSRPCLANARLIRPASAALSTCSFAGVFFSLSPGACPCSYKWTAWGTLVIILGVLWLVIAIVVGAAAGARGRSTVGWFLLSVLISPLLAGLLLAILPDLRTRALIEELHSGRSVDDRALRQSVQAGQRSVIPARSSITIALRVLIGAVLFGAIAFLAYSGSRDTSVGPRDGNEPKKNAPDAFRGVKWDAPLLSAQKLRETALKGCISIVEQKDLISNAPCSRLHIDNDDIDTFAQRQKVAPLFDVPISEQTLSWSYKKFWAGDVYVYNYNDADLAKLRSALVEHYGPPTVTNDSQHLTEWDWTDKKIKVRLTFDPVPKPDIGGGTQKTSIWLHFVKE